MKNLFNKTWTWLALSLAIAFVAMLLDFAVLGIYQYQGDTPTYIGAIDYYDNGSINANAYGGNKEMLEFRLLKPIYGVLGSFMTPLLAPHQTILFLNLACFYGTVTILFFILLTLGFSAKEAALGTTWFSFGYPVLKYGFSLITDISGYFFIALTCYLALIGFNKKKSVWFLWAGIIAAIGALSKESGALGMLFIIGASIINIKRLGWRFACLSIFLAIAAFSIIYLPIETIIIQSIGYTFFDFFKKTQHSYYDSYPATLFYFLIHGATFHIVWLYAGIGTIGWIIQKKDRIWLGAWLVGVPTVFWLMYVTRYAYVYFIAVIPFALYGLKYSTDFFTGMKETTKKRLVISCIILPSLINICLLLGAKNGAYLNFLLK